MLAHENPFATQRVEKLLQFNPELLQTSWEAIEQRWEELGKRCSIIGPHGAGKTTMLDAFQQRLEARLESTLRLFLNSSNTSLSSDEWSQLEHCQNTIVILDGEEQLNFFARRRFYKATKQAKGVVVTRHKKGKLPTLLECVPTFSTLEYCIQILAPEHKNCLHPHLREWWETDDQNISHILLRCYDFCANAS